MSDRPAPAVSISVGGFRGCVAGLWREFITAGEGVVGVVVWIVGWCVDRRAFFDPFD